ncbi:MAG: hypothetical protein KAR21_10320 [Spirochaetales bacterium]|nr:hypothetical protein [Spirochaetales bacterium]
MMVNKFFKILSIEFSDLEDGIETLIGSISERYRRKEITEYVMKENSTLLRRELTDMLIIHRKIMEISPDSYQTVEEATAAVIDIIFGFTGIPEAVHTFMERRVRKVLRYMDEVY